MIKQNKKAEFTTGKMLGYCVGDIFGGGAFTLVGMLYMNFLTDDILLSAAAVGVMMFIGKIWDAIIDPFIGNISEQARNKMGRRRVFFFAGIFHIGACFLALWVPMTSAPVWVKCIYFTLAYMLFATSFSLTMVPYHAMLPELTNDLKKRNKTVSIRSMISNASSMISGLVPAMLVTFGATIMPQASYLFMGLCFAIFYTIPWIIVFNATRGLDESNIEGPKEKIKIFEGFFKNAKTVLRNKSFTKMLGLYLLSYTAMDIFMAIIIYYVKWYLGIYGIDNVLGLGIYTFLLGIFMIFELLSIPVYTILENKIGKRKSFIISTALWSSATIVLIFMSSPEMYAISKMFVIIPVALMGFGAGGVALLPWAMLPETMDVEELISGERKDAIYSGFLTFIRQLSQAVALLIVGIFLDSIDYGIGDIIKELTNSGVIEFAADGSYKLASALEGAEYQAVFNVMPEGAKLGIKYFTSLAPAILLMLSMIVSFSYPIDNNNFILIHNEIKNRNTNSKEDLETLEKIVGKKNYKEMLSQQNKKL